MATAIVGLRCKDAAQVIEPGKALGLLAAGLPIQLFKDMFSMKALAEHGGIWTDLDVFWLGKQLPIHSSGYAFALEPHSRPAQAFMGRKSPRAHLGLLAMPKDAPLAMDLYCKWSSKWKNWVIAQDPSKPFMWKDTAGWHAWMHNTNMFSQFALKLAQTMSGEPSIVQQPWVFMPLALTFSQADLNDMAMVSTSSSASPPIIDCQFPYKSPTLADMALHSCTVNLWTRQLGAPLKAKLVDMMSTLRRTALDMNSKSTVTKMHETLPELGSVHVAGSDKVAAVRAAIEAFSSDVLEAMDVARGHQLLAYAHCLLAEPLVTQIVQTGGRCVKARSPGCGGWPKTLTGIGPWFGPEPHARVWAALFLWMGVLLCQRDPAVTWSEYDADPDGLSAVFVPGPGIQPEHGPSQQKLLELTAKLFQAHVGVPGHSEHQPASVKCLQVWFAAVRPEKQRPGRAA